LIHKGGLLWLPFLFGFVMKSHSAAEAQVYDNIGCGYVVTRQPDPRIARMIHSALGDARTVLNVGAGTGSYEPAGRQVVAVEPSLGMIHQRRTGTVPVIRAVAEHLPFSEAVFDASLAVLTMHHWHDRRAGLAELRRVTRHRIVIYTWDPACYDAFWLGAHYLPEVRDLDLPRFPNMQELAQQLGAIESHPVPIPHDCVDGFLGAYWRRPEAYREPHVCRAMSGLAQLPQKIVEAAMTRLADDLRSGRWDEQFGWLRKLESIDLGYRLIIARLTA